jgi:hypothetical protein
MTKNNSTAVTPITEQYPSELKRLKKLITDDVWQLFDEAGVIIAGGAITSLFTNSDVNDLDVYFRSEEQLVRVIAAIYQDDNFSGELFDIADQYSMVYNGNSQRTLMFKNAEQHVQFMTFRYFDKVEEIFDTFDFTCCMGAYDFKHKRFALHKDFLKHNAQKYLKFHKGTAYPIMSLMRVDKYRKKGYDISKAELLRICATCMNLSINSWEDIKDHVGGMYGYDLDDVFNEDVEFSLDEFIDQLSGVDERDIAEYKHNTKDTSMWGVFRSFIQVELPEQNNPKFDDKKYLYKCVNSDWKSPMSSHRSKVHYGVGKEIECSDSNPLFFHASSTQPYYTSKYWVEAQLIEGKLRDVIFNEKVAVSGKILVTRNFEYDISNDAFVQAVRARYSI